MYSDQELLAQKMRPKKLRDQLRIPPITWELICNALALPEKFVGDCTLREGMTITLIVLQTVCVLFMVIAGTILYWFHDKASYFFRRKFKEDFDPYFMYENTELINKLWPLWDDVTALLIIIHGAYFFVGFGVCYALNVKNASTLWYLPWLLMTGFLVTSIFATGIGIFVGNIILFTYRDLSVTWDIAPMVLVFVYGYFWAYGFAVSVAHYKRRCIVSYWEESQRKLGNLNF